MNRRAVLIGGAAAVGVAVPAGIGGLALWARQDIDAWRDAVAAIRRPLGAGAVGPRGAHRTCPLCHAGGEQPQYASLAVRARRSPPSSIIPDVARRTPVVDPDDHHLFASLGAAVENIVQAAPIFGLAAKPHFDPGGDGRIVIELRAGDTATSETAAAIVKRQCTRSGL